MLVETVIQYVGPMLLELAIREVAVPAAKKFVRQGAVQQPGLVADAPSGDSTTIEPRLSPVRAVQVASAIAGRVRADVAGLSGQPDLARQLDRNIAGLVGVLEAKANVRTGRMLVTFDPAHQSVESLTAAMDRVRAAYLVPPASRSRHLAVVV